MRIGHIWKIGSSIAIAFVTMLDTSASAQSLRCDVTEKFQCEPSKGCTSVPPTVWVLIDTEASSYSRCDAKGCDRYTPSFSESGQFVIVDLPGRGMVAKMSTGGGQFMEAVTLGMQTFVSYGHCQQ